MALNGAMLKCVALARVFSIETPLPTLRESCRASFPIHPSWCLCRFEVLRRLPVLDGVVLGERRRMEKGLR
eukprot:4065964-Pyramimonas_sp.AAC.1